MRKEQSLEKQIFQQSCMTLTKDTSAPELSPMISPTLQPSTSPTFPSKAQLPPISTFLDPPAKKKRKVPRSKKYLDSLAGQMADLSPEAQELLKSALENVPKVTAKSWVGG
jgi:hypothetical protein